MEEVRDTLADALSALEAENRDLRYRLSALEAVRTGRSGPLFAEFLDYLPLMVCVIGADGQIELVNRAWETTLGWTSQELAPQLSAYLRERAFWPIATLDKGHLPDKECSAQWRELPVRTRDGKIINTAWTTVSLDNGRRMGIGQEIALLKQSKENLKSSEEVFRQLAENIRIIFWVYDIETDRVLYVSPAYATVWERSVEVLYTDVRSSFDSIHPDDRERCLSLFGAQLRNPSNLEYEYRIICPSGVTKRISERQFTVTNQESRVNRIVGISEDVTERRSSDEMLHRIRNYLTEAERLSHVGSWSYSVVTKEVLFWSDEHFRIFGFDPAAGTPPFSTLVQRIHPEDMEALDIFQQAIVQRSGYEARYRIVLPDGEVKQIVSIGHPVRNENGEVLEFTGVAMDVTERKKAEEELQSSFVQLRALATQLERVREEEGRKIARELHDELGSALTSLKWDIEELENVWIEATQRLNSEALRSRFSRMRTLADRTIQTVKRISSELRPVILDDLGIVEALEWQCQEFGGRTGIPCRFNIANDCPDFNHEHSSAIFRIVQEALTNILRHAQANQVEIRAERRPHEWVLIITDDGRGTTPERLTSSRSLGILGMRERAYLLGGKLELSTGDGTGLVVSVHIPFSNLNA